MHRREFLKSSLVGAGLALSIRVLDRPTTAQAQEQAKPKAMLRLSSQEGLIPGKNLREKVEKLQKWGAAGIELSPWIVGRVKQAQDALAGTNIKVSAICAADGPYIVPDRDARQQRIDNAKRILDAAGELGSTGVIMVPAFNGVKDQLQNPEARKVLMDVLKELGAHAEKAGTRMLLEPLNRGEAWYLRMLADAASICRDVNSPGVGMMGDFYHMHLEETSDMGAFISAGKWLHHVHLASRSRARTMPHQDNSDYRDGFRGLKMIGYQDFCSLECGCRGNRDEETPKTFRYLEKQWEEATI